MSAAPDAPRGTDGKALRRRFWGWGYEGHGPSAEQAAGIARLLGQRFDRSDVALRPEPRLEDVRMPTCRLAPPAPLAPLCSTAPFDRASHTYGKAYRDIVRGVRGEFDAAPDLVAFPRDESDVTALLDWCADARVAAIPFGGGSSVVGGVEARNLDAYTGALSLDLTRLDRLLELDRTSRAARFQAGILGPALEDALRPHGLTLRHFPQSFELSTLGGWIATRSGGHYATLHTHIDDFVESLRVITPKGVIETRRLPGSGAGPSPDRLFIGSEGILGVITEAWMRVQERPRFRATASVRFEGDEGFLRGARGVRTLAQSGLHPANCRLLDPLEAQLAGAGDGASAVLLIGFESADHPLDAWLDRALEIARDAGGEPPAQERAREGERSESGAAGAWRNAFLQAPYVRDVLVRAGFVSETFESAVTWDRFEALHAAVRERVGDALAHICGAGSLSCRFTHAYPDGPAVYYTVLAPARAGAELEQWDAIKSEASDALLRNGGTITHHHAVGRDHRPGYECQRPELVARALRAAKTALDPMGVLNPGVLLDPEHS